LTGVTAAATALIFPGQGSHVVGMGRALAETYPEARAIFAQADEVLGFALSRLCFDGPEAELTDTLNQQPAILTASIAALRAIEARAPNTRPAFVAGHSLGEFSALVAAGSLKFEDAVQLVRERGRLMKQAGDLAPGGMAAILNLDRDALAAVCNEASQATGQRVQIANDNSPGQIVISGDKAALDKAMELAKAKGARRAIPLAVSIAAHSHLMQPIARSFRGELDAIAFGPMRLPVISNVYARPIDFSDLRDELEAQLTTPVRWTETIQYLVAQGVTRCVEVGPKDVLAGLVRRIDSSVSVMSVGDPTGVELLLA
jgi:[acyl-carrier-protein] S-malonyltransferase